MFWILGLLPCVITGIASKLGKIAKLARTGVSKWWAESAPQEQPQEKTLDLIGLRLCLWADCVTLDVSQGRPCHV